ncbi:hypothetical protein BC939DRAFT_488813 [Gamsiella multidivaricata]|uniref:uncharacterized protein n=1 Tax=Gamsiella multidivaricata TaxID=101098 RepID=UPI00221F3CBD|nr:uncharacterized protein BC939DRAFT_488813 [Gamsiella multidivaricata]KAG0363808.1 hypothetical protein BGZ54_008010 [Gamsiella multidivaricata]KAI7832308.1 hypothetical protein BC939DRAFT_488813 [Gamsiella multidivaricata]
MKLTLSVAVLALAASQAMAVVPIPIKECTKSVVVEPTDVSCIDFATKYGTTFENLLKWNQKLRDDCKNLDVGEPICVSITPGDCCLKENPNHVTVPGSMPTSSVAEPATNVTSTVVSGAPTTAGTVTATTVTSAATAPTVTAPTAISSSAANKPTTTATPISSTQPSEAAGSKISMMLAAAGVMLSVAYML